MRVRDTEQRLAALSSARDDVHDAGNVAELVMEQAPELSVEVELAAEPESTA